MGVRLLGFFFIQHLFKYSYGCILGILMWYSILMDLIMLNYLCIPDVLGIPECKLELLLGFNVFLLF